MGIPSKEIVHGDIPEWLLYISKGNLLYPCPELEKVAFVMENLFQNEHKDKFSEKPNIIDRLSAQVL